MKYSSFIFSKKTVSLAVASVCLLGASSAYAAWPSDLDRGEWRREEVKKRELTRKESQSKEERKGIALAGVGTLLERLLGGTSSATSSPKEDDDKPVAPPTATSTAPSGQTGTSSPAATSTSPVATTTPPVATTTPTSTTPVLPVKPYPTSTPTTTLAAAFYPGVFSRIEPGEYYSRTTLPVHVTERLYQIALACCVLGSLFISGLLDPVFERQSVARTSSRLVS